MGILRFFGRLNCFGSTQRKLKSRRNMERELSNMQETIRNLQQDIETTRSVVELCKQRQRAAEEKQEMTRNTRSHLMAQVEQIESRLGRVVEKRQEPMSDIIDTLQAMEKKAIFFWNDLSNPAEDQKNVAETWKPGKLRRVRAMNDLYKAGTQPSLCPSQDYVGWEVPEDSRDEDALMEILKNENYEESLIVSELFF